jgi:hypothetical protein
LRYDPDVDGTEFAILQAASRVLNAKRPDKRDVEILTSYADVHIPEHAFLPLDDWPLL